MSSYEIVQFPALRDNYGFLLHDKRTKSTAAIDTPEAEKVIEALNAQGWELTHILNTHHHHDHAGGNVELCAKYPQVQVVAPALEKDKIPGTIHMSVLGGDCIQLGALKIQVIDVGGHTLGHVAYYCPEADSAFVGDAIFAMGCGRMFEGTYEQFTHSLKRICELPDSTILYCAHEYTLANAKFALTVDPHNSDLIARVHDVQTKRANNVPTVPTTLALEKATNPFIRFDALKSAMKLPSEASDIDVFAAVRKAKDAF